MSQGKRTGLASHVRRKIAASAVVLQTLFVAAAQATPFTMTVPGTGVALPDEYPEAGGVAFVLTGVNGNIYYQFSNPDGAFVGFQNTGQPARFRGNPFTINDPVELDCGFRGCTDYFGGALARVDIRFSAFDGDTQTGGFDENDISLIINGVNVGSWSGRTTDSTNEAGTTSFGLEQGFGNNSFNTGWFSSTNQALLADILQTNQTVSQVFDRDPNDNFWDFTRGPSLPRDNLRTVAPGIEFEKTIDAGGETYSAVGDVIDYTYVVRNIGSVDIDDITVEDDRIPNVQCPEPPQNSLRRTRSGQPQANELECTASYRITQADIDAGSVVNLATANGTPEFGDLGAVSDTATTTGPAPNNAITLTKSGAPDPFGPVGSTVTYTLTATNTGNTTLSNLLITDPLTPGQSCTFDTLLPLSADNGVNTASCTVTYQVTQADVDAFGLRGETLDNTATVRATTPANDQITATGSEALPGRPADVALTLDKTALQTTYDAVGDVIDYRFTIRNAGNVTWPGAPDVTDDLTGGANCPAGQVAPGGTIVCTASYTIQQADLDAGERPNEATASLTLAGQTATDTDDETVTADVTTALALEKRTAATSPTTFTQPGQVLSYEFVLTNEGTVTLSNPSVSDATTGANATAIAVDCPAGPIAPGGSVTCTADYTVTQADLDAGSVTNGATASADSPPGLGGAPVNSDPQSVTVDAEQRPALEIVKTAPEVTALQFAGLPEVTYTYEVTNTGNVTIPGPITVTDDRLDPQTFTCTSDPIAVGDSVQCTETYQVTTADVQDGTVRNNAFAEGADGTRSNVASAVIPQDGTFDFQMEKEAITADYAAVGDPVDFTLTFTNIGENTIFPGTDGSSRDRFVFSDPGVTFPNGCTLPNPIFPVGSGQTPTGFTCTVRRAITQGDIDAGSYTNTATLTLIYNEGDADEETQVVPPASDTVPLSADVEPSFTLVKDTPDTFAQVGDTLTYDFTVTNTSAITLTNVTLTDPKIATITCPGSGVDNQTGAIAPGGTITCSGSYQVDQADLDNERVENTVTATGDTQSAGSIEETADETTQIAPGAATRELALTKSVTVRETGDATFSAVGQTADYVFEVRNVGNLTLDNISVVDPDLSFTCSIATLAPGASDDTTCTASRVLTQADLDAGTYRNDAIGSAAGAADVPASATVTAQGRTAQFQFTKSAPATFDAAGEIVDFVFSFVNTGNVTLTDITIVDPLLGASYSCDIPSVAPGQTDTTCRGTYEVQSGDVDAGQIENDASFTGRGVDGAPISGADTVVVQGPDEVPELTVTKVEADGNGRFEHLPASEDYTFTVANTGNVRIVNLTFVDDLTGFTCQLPDLAAGEQTTVCDDGRPLRDTYTVQQSDIDAGELENTATASGETTRGTGTPVSGSDTVTLSGPDQLPALTLDKSVTAGAGYDAVGDTISYQYLITNAGNITLTAPIRVDDDRVSVSCPALPAGGLPPGDSLTCTATDTVDQADLDAGEVTNVATGSVTQPVDASPTCPDGVAEVSSNTDTQTVTADQTPALAITKRIKAGSPSSFDGPGDLDDPSNPNNLVFEFVVQNTGNVTTTDPIVVSDPQISADPLTCTTDPVAPGGRALCELAYAPTQADVDRGFFANSADATTQFDGATVETQTPGTERVNAIRRPELSIVKSLENLDEFAPGEVATYRFDVSNAGNTTIPGPITVTDNKIPGPIDCGTDDLAPGDSTSCLGTYTVRARDLDAGSVTNNASAGNGTIQSDPQSLTVPIDADPTLSLDKTALVTEFTQAGDVIPYEFEVSNTSSGDIPPAFIEPVVIIDDKIESEISCPVVDADNPLRAGDSIVCTGSYTVTQADVDATRTGFERGFVINNAFARSEFAGETVESETAREEVRANSVAAFTVEKSAENLTDPGQDADAGDTLRFTITTVNAGAQTLTDVRVTDPFLDVLSCDLPTPARLAPGERLICTGSYTVTQADVDAGDPIANTADVNGNTTQGAPVSGTDSTTYDVADPLPSMQVSKALIRGSGQDDFNTPGEELDFRVTVTNDGNVTLNALRVTDDLVAGTCTIPTIAPGASDDSCVFTYTVQQSDIDRGTLTNTATARAQPANPGADELVESGQSTINGPDREPRIGLSKTGSGEVTASDGSPTFNVAGQTLSYEYVVANLGNVTLNQPPQVTDDRIDPVTCDPLPQGGLEPGDTLICRGTDTVDQDDLNAGFVTNLAQATVANDYGGPPLQAQAEETITATIEPDLNVEKTASVTQGATAGTEVTYSYLVQNPGNVTLSDITLVDFQTSAAGSQQLAISDGGTIASLDPGGQVTLTATYTITQADIDAGDAVRNTVRLTSALPNGDTGPTAQDRARVDLATQRPEMTAIKTIPTPPATVVAGTEIVFEIALTNTGNVTLSEPSLTDEVRQIETGTLVGQPDAILSSGDTGDAGVFEVGERRIYEVRYVLTQDDIDAGGIANSATATATDPNGADVTEVSDNGAGDGDDPTAFAIAPTPALDVTKVITSAPVDPSSGSTIEFEISVANAGNVTLSAPVLTEDLRQADAAGTPVTSQPVPVRVAGSDTNGNGTLDPSEIWTYTVSYTLTQADIDAGGVSNSVLAEATDPNGDPVSDTSDDGNDADGNTVDDRTVFVIDRTPALDLTKVILQGGSAVGDTVVFEIRARNLGNVTLSNPALTDTFTRFDGSTVTGAQPVIFSGGPASDPLLPGDERVWRLSRTLTQRDIDGGGLRNSATLTATDPDGATVRDVSDDGDDTDGNLRDDPTELAIAGEAELDLVKRLTQSGTVAGDRVVFTLTATNIGDLTLSDVTLADQFTRADGTAITASTPVLEDPAQADAPLAPNETRVWTLTHRLTQADIDAGGLSNTARVSSTAPGGAPVSDRSDDGDDTDGNTVDDPTQLLIEPAPDLTLTKTIARSGADVGDLVIFEITAVNTGNLTLRNLEITDTLTDLAGNPRSVPDPEFVSGDDAARLDVGAANVYRVRYVLTQDDLDAGGLSNVAAGQATTPGGGTIQDVADNGDDTDGNTQDDPTILNVETTPALAAVKAIVAGPTEVGERVIYDIRVTNTGNVTLQDARIESDTLTRADGTPLTLTSGPVLRSSDQGSPAGTLAVGETAVWRASYVLTQADIDAGGVQNIAVATATPDVGDPVFAQTRDQDEADGNPANDPTVLSVTRTPALAVDKVLVAGGPTFDAVGDVLEFRFDATNTGNVTLTDPIEIEDPRLTDAGNAIACPTGPVAPGETVSCTGQYSVTQADLDAGEVTNTARAVSGDTISAPDSVTVPANQTPALTTAKSAVSITFNGVTYPGADPQYFRNGAIVNYEFVVTNTGNVTLTDPITVRDDLVAVDCPATPGGLSPRAAITCTASYGVNLSDVALGAVTNVATAQAGALVGTSDSATIPQGGTPALTVTKALFAVADPDGTPQGDLLFDEVGDRLTYRFTVENVGNVSFARDIVVNDARLNGPLTCFSAVNDDFAPGDSTICEGVYVVTQDDLDAGEIPNEATATTQFSSGGDTSRVTSIPARIVSPAAATSELTLVKSVETLPVERVGQTLTYTLTITNTGNQRLTSVRGTDALLPDLICARDVLAPQQVLTCAADYTITQADVDRGTLENTARVAAITPRGEARNASDTLVTAMPDPRNDLTLLKRPNVANFAGVGSTIGFDLVVTNGGNLTLTDLVVTDPSIDPDYVCRIAELAPGESNSVCTISRLVTQDDVDAGELTNEAFVTGTDARGGPVSAQDTVVVTSQPRIAALDVTKILTQPGENAAESVGDTVSFLISARNSGEVTLRNIALEDRFTRRDGTPIEDAQPVPQDPSAVTAPLLPGETLFWTLEHRLTQSDIDAGGVSNVAVVRATDPANAVVEDLSNDGNDADGNTEDDPTELILETDSTIELVKELTQSGGQVGDTLVFTLTATNTGTTTLSDLVLTDTFTRADGTAIDGSTPVLTDPDDPAASIAPGEDWVWTLEHELTQSDVDAGGVINTATITALSPAGIEVLDVSDNGIDSDGNVTDDPTELLIGAEPALDVVKRIVEPAAAVGETVVYEIAVTNIGNVTLSDLAIADTMSAADGTPRDSGPVEWIDGADEVTLAVGQTNLYEVRYVLTQEDIDAGGLENVATASATGPGGSLVETASRDLNGLVGEATALVIEGISEVDVTKSVGVPVRLGPDRVRYDFEIAVENTGNVTQTGLRVRDDLRRFAEPARVVSIQNLTARGFAGPGVRNNAFNGRSDTQTLRGDVRLAPGDTGVVAFSVLLDIGSGGPRRPNRAVVTSDTLEGQTVGTVRVPVLPPAEVRVTKVADVQTALLGGTVGYTLTFENVNRSVERNLTFVDALPPGLAYTPGSAVFDGREGADPVIDGSRLEWRGVSLGPNETVTVTLSARVTGGDEDLSNIAYALDSAGNVISNRAESVIVRRPEAVFDCGDVIGKVFDDRNLNGYQDGVEEAGGITDQTYDGGKFGAPERVLPGGEPGLAGVRLSTVDGTILTTDAYGRFSVPCAALPAQIGSNFTLKLDTRSLPTGYEITTENPRTIRLTAGTVAKMNFGAAVANVVRIDLTAAAFVGQSTSPTHELEAGIAALVGQIREIPTVLQLSYYTNAETRALARARLNVVDDLIQSQWDGSARYRLLIERSIKAGQ